MKADQRARVLASHAEEYRLDDLCALIGTLGHEVVGRATTVDELQTLARRETVDLILTPPELGSERTLPVLSRLGEVGPVPSVILARRPHLADIQRALDDHVMAYLVEPVSLGELRPTVPLVLRRFAEFEALREENSDLRAALQARKEVE